MEKRYDVLVAGAGPAGMGAALAAAENGAQVLLVERSGFAGGMSTDGLLNVFCGSASSKLFGEISRELVVRKGHRQVYDGEELKAFYLDKLSQWGVDCRFHTLIAGCRMAGEGPSGAGLSAARPSADAPAGERRLAAVTCFGPAGTAEELSASVYVDATGDGALAALAGVGYTVGREEDGRTEPMSLMVRLGGVDDSQAVYPTFGTHPDLEERAREAVQAGEILPPAGHVILIPDKHPGIACMNMTNAIGLVGSDPEARTRAELQCREQLPGLLRFLRQQVPGYRDAFVLSTAAYTGVRESRHFDGEYCLTQEDIQDNRIFDDWCVSRAKYGFGAHNPDGSGKAAGNRAVDGCYTIPYRCLLPRGVENLLLAGRCICGTHTAHSSYRVMPICMAIGQAAGTAAALSLASEGTVRQVDPSQLQQRLTAQGVTPPR